MMKKEKIKTVAIWVLAALVVLLAACNLYLFRFTGAFQNALSQLRMKNALLAVENEEWNEAKESYDAILQSDPEHPRALRGRGNIALTEGNVDEAIQYYRRAVDHQDHPSAKMLAICYLKADHPEKIGPLVPILMPHKTENVDYVTVLVAYAISQEDPTLYRDVLKDVPQDLIDQREGLVKLIDKGNQMFKD